MDIDFEKEHLDNFNREEFSLEVNEDIENNFLYAIPTLCTYLYQKIGKDAKDIILSLLSFYELHTKERFLDIDFSKTKKIPKEFKEYSKNNEVGEDFLIYLFGNEYYYNYNDNKKEHKYKRDFSEYLIKSSFFRKKIDKMVNYLNDYKKTEFIRGLVNQSLDDLPSINTISSKKWYKYLTDSIKEELDDFDDEYDYLEKDERKQKKKNFKKYLREIKQKKKEEKNNDEKVEILENIAKCDESRREIEENINSEDFIGLEDTQDLIAFRVKKALRRYHIERDRTDHEAGIPKNFINNFTFSCFSGVWLGASLLMKSGIRKEDIFIADGVKSRDKMYYKHSFLLIRKANGEFITFDYGFQKVEFIRGKRAKEVEKKIISGLEYGLSEIRYSNHRGEIHGIDRNGFLYNLSDGIIIHYLTSVIGLDIENKDYDNALENLSLLESFNKNYYYIYAIRGLIYKEQGKINKAEDNFKKCLNLHGTHLESIFLYGELLFERGDYDESIGYLRFFLSKYNKMRGENKKYILKTKEYLKTLKEKGIYFGYENHDNYKNLKKLEKEYETMFREYFVYEGGFDEFKYYFYGRDEKFRGGMIKFLFKGIAKTQKDGALRVNYILLLFNIFREEKKLDSNLYKKYGEFDEYNFNLTKNKK